MLFVLFHGAAWVGRVGGSRGWVAWVGRAGGPKRRAARARSAQGAQGGTGTVPWAGRDRWGGRPRKMLDAKPHPGPTTPEAGTEQNCGWSASETPGTSPRQPGGRGDQSPAWALTLGIGGQPGARRKFKKPSNGPIPWLWEWGAAERGATAPRTQGPGTSCVLPKELDVVTS